jgi:hypothetical protein
MNSIRQTVALVAVFSVVHANAAPLTRAPAFKGGAAPVGTAGVPALGVQSSALNLSFSAPALGGSLPTLAPLVLPEAHTAQAAAARAETPKPGKNAPETAAPLTPERAERRFAVLTRFLKKTGEAQRQLARDANSERVPDSAAHSRSSAFFDRSPSASGVYADAPRGEDGRSLAGGARLKPMQMIPQDVKNAVPSPQAAKKKEEKKKRKGNLLQRWKLFLTIGVVLAAGVFGAYKYFSPRLDPVTPPDAVVIVDKSPYAMTEDAAAAIERSEKDPSIVLSGHEAPVRAFTIRADRKAAVSVAADGTWKLWDLENGKVYAPENYPGKARTALFAEGGKKLILVDEDGTVRVSTLRTGEIQTIGRDLDSIRFEAISPDAQRVAVGTSDNKVHILELGTANPTAFAVGGKILAVGSTESGEMVLTSSRGIVKLWKVEPGQEPTVVVEKYLPGLKIKGSALSRSGDRLIALAEMAGDQIVLAWRFGTEDVQMIMGYDFAGEDETLAGVASTPDGSQVAILGKDGRLWLWTPGSEQPEPIGKAESGAKVFFSKTGTVIWTADQSGRLQAWTVPSPAPSPDIPR